MPAGTPSHRHPLPLTLPRPRHPIGQNWCVSEKRKPSPLTMTLRRRYSWRRGRSTRREGMAWDRMGRHRCNEMRCNATQCDTMPCNAMRVMGSSEAASHCWRTSVARGVDGPPTLRGPPAARRCSGSHGRTRTAERMACHLPLRPPGPEAPHLATRVMPSRRASSFIQVSSFPSLLRGSATVGISPAVLTSC